MSIAHDDSNIESHVPRQSSFLAKMELLYAWTGWLSGVTFLLFAVGSAEFAWFVRASLGLMGLHLLLYWILERIEARRGEKLLRLRKALLPLFFAAPIIFVACCIGWLTATR